MNRKFSMHPVMPRLQTLVHAVLPVMLVALSVFPTLVQAQTSMPEEEHKSHHPSPAESGSEASSSEASNAGGMGGGGMGGGMKEMMKAMARPKSTELFPALIKLPELSSEQRAVMQNQAQQRVSEGVALLQEGFGDLTQALGRDDAPAMQSSAAAIEEGLSRFRSGLAVRQALAEGIAPRRTALQWYKSQLNLLPPTDMRSSARVLGMTPFALFVCLLSLAVGLALVTIYLIKVRRASALLERLTAGKAGAEVPAAAGPQTSTDAPSPPAASAPGCCPTATGGEGRGEGLLAKESRKLCRLRVVRIYQETPVVKTFRMVACDGASIPFSYQPGQFLTIAIPHEGKTIKRNYTISSSPTQGYYCEITVKREEHGIGSRYLHDVVKEGDTLEVRPPAGRFVFTGDEAENIVLIGGGVGVTPMMSIVRAMLDRGWKGELSFVYACRTLEDFIFADELTVLKRRNPNLQTFIVVSELEEEVEGLHRGRLTKERLAEWVPEIAARRIHLCGSPPMMEASRKMLAELGVPKDQVKFEMFGPPPSAKAGEDSATEEEETEAAPAATGPAVTFSLSEKSGQLQPGETVLEAAERMGVEIDSSCRAGSCGMCAVKLLEGQVEMANEDGLDPEDKAQGMILACQAKARTDLTIEA